MQFKRTATVLAAATILGLVGTGGAAIAGDMIGTFDIKNNSVRSKDIHDGTVNLKDIRDTAEAKLRGQRGPAGPAGATGATGARGPAGESHDINATWTANPDSRVAGYTAVLKGTNTSVETTNLGVTVQAGDVISFEYTLLDGATCGAGGPRMYVKIGATYENTFDATTNCGTNGEVVYPVANGGTITEAGLVHDNGSGGTVYVTDVLVDGRPVYFG